MKYLSSAGVLLAVLMFFVGSRTGRYRCHACGARFCPDPEQLRFGHCPCPKCGTSVEVDH